MASGHEIPQPNFAELEEFLELLQGVTSGLEGKVIIASFGQNPSSSENLNPLIRHFEPSPELAQKILAFVTEHLSEPHRNFYFCGSTMRTDLPCG